MRAVKWSLVVGCAVLLLACNNRSSPPSSLQQRKAEQELQDLKEAPVARRAALIAVRHGVATDMVKRVLLRREDGPTMEKRMKAFEEGKISVAEMVSPDRRPHIEQLAREEGVDLKLIANIIFDNAVLACEESE